MEGTLVSETDTEIRLQMANENRTITFTRVLQKSDVKSITRDTPEQKAQQTAYCALDKYKLYPSQELTAGLRMSMTQSNHSAENALAERADYPNSSHTEEIRGRVADWNAEAANVQSGKVKFAGKWVLPEEKRQRSLQQQRVDLQTQRDALDVSVAGAEGKLAGLRTKLNTLPRQIRQPIYSQSRFTGKYQNVPNPELAKVQADIIASEQSVAEGKATLRALDAKLRSLGAPVPQSTRAKTPTDLAPSNVSGDVLNEDQRLVAQWTDRKFHGLLDEPSSNAVPTLRERAFDRQQTDSRDRWMSVRALGLLGDKQSVPDMIHLLYHYNSNTRWWAQISLVRLTGQNFGMGWKAWGNWWNSQNGQPPFNPEIIRWSRNQTEPGELAGSLAESDRKFLEGLKGNAR